MLTREQFIERNSLIPEQYTMKGTYLDDVCSALAVYERVVALLEHYRKLKPHEMPAASLVLDELRRAVKGT